MKMIRNLFFKILYHSAFIIIVSLVSSCITQGMSQALNTAEATLIITDTSGQTPTGIDSITRRKELDGILKLLPRDQTGRGQVSYLDKTFTDWVQRTGELPPNFDKMPSIPYLPNPLILDEGTKNIPVTTMKQWEEKRKWMEKELQFYITGTFPPPPPPGNLIARVVSDEKDGTVTIRKVVLNFGPGRQAKMTLELFIPQGEGPFPVFMTQWNHINWARLAATRGYIGCIYAGCDFKDDTKNYSEIWSGKFTFSLLMERAYGASRVVDYLYGLSSVNKKQIGITGHSRNGKQSLWAAAYDKRFTGVIVSSGNSGGGLPWRYSAHKYGCEDIALLTSAQPAWLNPRLSFFTGREFKLPVDNNSFMALVAPRGLMLCNSRRESDGNPWGYEQVYDSTLKVYQFLGAPNHLAIKLRDGKHGTSARDIQDYIDFFDYIFERPGGKKPLNKLYYEYSFKKWCEISHENINPLNYPTKTTHDLVMDSNGGIIHSPQAWEHKKKNIQGILHWALGETPSEVTNRGPLTFEDAGIMGESYYGSTISRPNGTPTMGKIPIAPGHSKPGFGNYLYGYLYYPKAKEEEMKKGTVKLPVIIWLHKYNYSNGFWDTQGFDHDKLPFLKSLVKQGYAVLLYDMMGFGNRIEEGTRFYQRYPHWSKMGKFVTDLTGAVTAMSNLNFIDSNHITVMGYSLGATVGLYGAALDKRISRVISVCGFTPMRTDTPDKGTEGIQRYCYLRGLLPRLGFFIGNQTYIPYDFDDILASIAPRPLLVIAPALDQDATLRDVKDCVNEVEKVYELYGRQSHVQLYSPYDYNRFSEIMQAKVLQWLQKTKSI
jgi:pimeloyl-ACP methyl ester carboxylesterase